MLEPASLEAIVKQFKRGGLTTIMTTPTKPVRFLACTSTRQSPRHRGDRPEIEPSLKEAPMNLTVTYLNPRVSRAPNIQLVKNVKYLIPLPCMSEDVFEEGGLLGHIQNLKNQDYNLQDPEKFSQFQND